MLRARVPLVMAGRSMIEMLGVLAIIGVLSAGGIMGYSVAMDNYRVNKTIDDISKFAVGASDLFRTIRPTTTSATMNYIRKEKLCELGLLTEPYCHGKNRWNTTSFVNFEENHNCIKWGTIKGNEPCAYLAFGVFDPPKSACVKLITHDWSGISPIKAYRLAIIEYSTPNGGSFVYKGEVNHKTSTMSAATAEQACTKTTYDYVGIEGRFYLRGTPL